MSRIPRLDKATIAGLTNLVPDQDDRDDMAMPSYLHRNPLINWIFWRRLDVAHGLLPPGRLGSVLDYGCGVGSLLPALAQKSDRVFGCDKRPGPATALVKQLALANVTVVDVGGFHRIPENSLDAVISADVLEHVDDLGNLVKTFHGKLTDKGVLIVSGPTENPLYRLGRKIAGFSGDYHVRTIFDIDAEIRRQGFQRAALKKLPVGFLPSILSLFHILRYTK